MLTDAVRDPPRAVAGDDLDGLALLPRQLLEEEVEHLLAVALVRPHDRVRLVVDDDRDVAVALAVAGLVDADQLQPLVALLRVRLEHLPRELDEPTDSLPVDAQQLGDALLAEPALDEPRRQADEVPREAGAGLRPGHHRRQHPVLLASDPRHPRDDPDGDRPEVHAAPCALHVDAVIHGAFAPALGASPLVLLRGVDAHGQGEPAVLVQRQVVVVDIGVLDIEQQL